MTQRGLLMMGVAVALASSVGLMGQTTVPNKDDKKKTEQIMPAFLPNQTKERGQMRCHEFIKSSLGRPAFRNGKHPAELHLEQPQPKSSDCAPAGVKRIFLAGAGA